MSSNEDEARRSLQDIEDAAGRARRVAAYAGADLTLVAWGIVWVLGYLGDEFIPRAVIALSPARAALIGWLISGWWCVLIIAGIASTIVIYKHHNPVESAVGRRIGWFWFALFGYAYLAGFLLMPFVKIEGSEECTRFWKHVGAVQAILPMFAYVVMGLWLDSFLVWVGLAVTALTVAGLLLLYPWFWIWMAVIGGGALIGTGVFIGRKWRSA